jgi:para-aminobenzoate synthetase component 1
MSERDGAAAPEDWTPEVRELSPAPTAVEVFRALCDLPHCVFLDSATTDVRLARYSYVAADPFAVVAEQPGPVSALERLRQQLGCWSSRRVEGLPPFQGGAAGMLAYELGQTLERLPSARCRDFDLPRLLMGLYDLVVAFDHGQQRAWIVSQGWPETDPARRRQRAEQRLETLARRIAAGPARPSAETAILKTGPLKTGPLKSEFAETPLELTRLAAHHPARGLQGAPEGLLSNFTREEYLRAVERAIEHIHAGDIFQVNLAQRLVFPARDDSVSLYLRLRERNPAPFAGYFDLGPYQIVSASPERFLHLDQGRVETRPIKGTRRRAVSAVADLFVGDDLRQSGKDRAENVMIVDLMRNDLSRVCEPESVQVTQLCQVETYQFVQHLVSAVTGTLMPGMSPVDLLQATFPGGSITGAPKIRAMEIIADLEPHARGAYCGSLGYIGWDGTMDLSILIRTITAGRGWWQLPVGGGIVAGSDPQREYEETWHKAEGLLRSL